MAVFNGEKYLHEAMASVLAQTKKDFEFIIVDDGSTDNSKDIIRSYNDPRIRLVVNPTNLRLPASLNKGIEVARSEYIARMDCDDICDPERMERQFEFLEKHPEVVALGTAATFMDETGEEIGLFTPAEDHQALLKIFPGSPFIHPSVMFRKSAYIEAGKYPEFMRWGAEDAVLFSKMAKVGKLSNLKESLLKYRLVPAGASRKPADFRALLLRMTREAVETNTVDPILVQKIEEKSKAIDKTNALVDYHFELAKLCLWSGGSSARARQHLSHCKSAPHLRVKVLMLKTLSYLPTCLIQHLYSHLKGRSYKKV